MIGEATPTNNKATKPTKPESQTNQASPWHPAKASIPMLPRLRVHMPGWRWENFTWPYGFTAADLGHGKLSQAGKTDLKVVGDNE